MGKRVSLWGWVGVVGIVSCHDGGGPADSPPPAVVLQSAASACTALRTMPRVDSAKLIASSGEYCQVNGHIPPTDPKAPSIYFQVNLPTNWNRKALQYGGGGFDGTLISGVDPLDMAPVGTPIPLARGYVTFGDDSGHQSKSITDGSFAANDEALANYGGLALKKTRDAAAALIEARYGAPATRTYFYGNSTGGRDGLTVIQRWPADYDGIVVNRPALNYTAVRLSNVRLGRALYGNNGSGWLNKTKIVHLQNAVMAACDALDGATDGLIANVVACRAKSAAILSAERCANGADTGNTCLSDAQIATVQTVASPLSLPYPLANGVTRYAGYDILAGAVFAGRYTTRDFGNSRKPSNPASKDDANQWVTGDQWAKYFIARNAKFESLTLDPSNPGAYQTRVQDVSALCDATSSDVSVFRNKGGKIIMTHGLADEIISAGSAVEYYEALVQRFSGPTVDEFVRFYLMPGVGHGTGPFLPAIDSLAALEQWVESGTAPETLTMADLHEDTHGRTRPLCRYPAWPKYVSGNVQSASSFRCVAE
ncbi:tannase/feruloyl esterase family alpha/beta hydrolase [Pendulispora rubella]|uniref:Tannase/feruloyl esterase family alpha/beta hydrolase n=1 Tax=Pendulispora rubella TaxID=2741070 RepID=A0ABZ2L2Y2_9BACT